MTVESVSILGGVFAAIAMAVVALTKRKPEASEIVVRMSMQLTERQQSMLEDRDERLAQLEEKYGTCLERIEMLEASLDTARDERDAALLRAAAAERRAEAAERRAEVAEAQAAEVPQLKERIEALEAEVETLRGGG